MFKPVGSKANFVQIEEGVLKYWRERDVFTRSIEARRQSPRFTLYEGPPTANGKPGIHHVISRVFKDVLPRYKTMQGYYSPRIAGWDTHGLPVELEVEKQLGFSNKSDIENYGIDKFNAKCKESVFRYLKDWDAITERIAFWLDLKNAYITMDNDYIESGWWTIKQMWDKGLIYKGYRTTPHCPRCGTSLSSHELAQGYKDDTPDPSIYIKFRLNDDATLQDLVSIGINPNIPVYLLAWTTTPWTLPGNTALAVAADADYAIVELENENIIIAYARLEMAGMSSARIVGTIKGKILVGSRYEALYNPHSYDVERKRFLSNSQQTSPVIQVQAPQLELSYPVIATDFVSMEEGTGIVHVAPAFGELDFDAGRKQGLDFVQPVDLQGKMTGKYSFTGKFVKSADKEIMSELKSRGLLFKSETIHHTYPFCWRCDAPLLYYAKQSWYIKTTAIKEKLISGNQEINWYPEHIKDGRFGDWLQNNVDWAFSRERYWGTPIPIWQCDGCSHQECIGSLEEMKNKSGFNGFKEPLDLHRPYVDGLKYECPHCKGTMVRVSDVIDCWFDSGNMPIAQWHYPFKKESLSIFEDGRFPADYICEAVDQTRGWFYSLHAISTLLFDQPCYKNVICLGHILDANGEKMSKSRGNVVDPWAVINKHGADALRWYLFTAAPPGNARRFSEQLVSEVTRQFMLILWNVYSFFITYANIDQFNPSISPTPDETAELDRWLDSELNQLVKDVTTNLDNYNITDAGRVIESFVVEYLSNWYIRRSRRRFWKSESDADKISAYHTLYNCLVTLSKLLAPFMPFLAEDIYGNLVLSIDSLAPESVHLVDFPKADENKIDKDLSASIRMVMRLSSLGRAARSQAGIKVRQPLGTGYIKLSSRIEADGFESVKPQLMEELNIKNIEVIDNLDIIDKMKYNIGTDGIYSIAIPTELSSELMAEGMAREIVHRLQTMRKNAGFEIADYITTYFQGDEYINSVMKDFSDYIKHETLSYQLLNSLPPEYAHKEEYKLDKHAFMLGVIKGH
jgi:isoleucyl-tRNA synthetase